jgi:anaerobic magnesium-protoporphyrin IX monomethyl ester cyclase
VLKILNKECTEEDNYFAIDLLTRIGDDMEAQGLEPPIFWSNIMLGIPGETREDAFKTMRMIKYTKRIMPSISFYAPYPGSALGHQLIAEGKSLMSKENYHRYPDDEKVKGIDYQFYRDLLSGKYDDEINRGLPTIRQERKNFWDALAKA